MQLEGLDAKMWPAWYISRYLRVVMLTGGDDDAYTLCGEVIQPMKDLSGYGYAHTYE